MATERQSTWFQGYTKWYLRAVLWTVQVAIVGIPLTLALDRAGMLVTGVLGVFLLFRQVDSHVRQKNNR